MQVTVEVVRRMFGEFNALIFGGRLPEVPFEISAAKGALGKCVYRATMAPDGRRRYSDFKIRISAAVEMDRELLEDVVIHEMIHYFILIHNLEDTSPHGEIFKALMRSINDTYGRHIAISHRNTPEETARAADSRRKVHVVAAIYFRSGECGVKVLPRVAERIAGFYNAITRAAVVRKVELYITDEPFFSRFPVSAALRIQKVDEDVLRANLAGARPLAVRGGRLVQ